MFQKRTKAWSKTIGYQWYQKIYQCERHTTQGNDQSKELSDKKNKNMRSTKPIEIKLLISWVSEKFSLPEIVRRK